MNKVVILILTCLLNFTIQSQELRRVEKPEFSASFYQQLEILEDDSVSVSHKLHLLDSVLPQTVNSYERYHLIFWYYPFLHMQQGDTASILQALKMGQQENLFYPLMTGSRKWPGYVSQIEVLPDFREFIHINDSLREASSRTASAEYFVALPENYDSSKNYPLMVVIHGGTGSHYQAWLSWHSQLLDKDFIRVFVQGQTVKGSFARRFDDNSYDDIIAMYEAVAGQFPVDEEHIYIGGPSAGGFRSMMLGFSQQIPAAGVVLMFPVMPRTPGVAELRSAATRKMNVVLITGENDWSIRQQKEFSFRMDTAGIKNRFIIYPGNGHEYPDDFSEQLDISIPFLTEHKNETESLIK